MKKKTPAPTEVKTSARSKRQFIGTENPRHLRVIMALLVSPRPREAIDRIAGASNGPELMAELRRRGLDCWRRPNLDHPCRLNFDQGREAVEMTAICG